MANFIGDGGDNLEIGTSGDDFFDMQQAGVDTVQAGEGDDAIEFGNDFTADDRVDGGDGTDVLAIMASSSAPVIFQADTMVGVESMLLVGGPFDLTLDDNNVAVGAELTVQVYSSGMAKGTRFDGSAETDGSFDFQLKNGLTEIQMIGGAGADTFALTEVPDRTDRLDGGGGYDQLMILGGAGAFHLAARTLVNIGAITLAGPITMKLNDANVAAGATLTVDMSGGYGDALTVDGHKETDGHLVLNGGSGLDNMVGGALSDTFDGGNSDDVLAGRGGADLLTGGAGHDRFVYYLVGDSWRQAPDLITDLTGGDVIDLTRIDADRTTAGNQSFTLVGAFSHTAGELMWSYDAAKDLTSLMGDVDGDGKADLVIHIGGDHQEFSALLL